MPPEAVLRRLELTVRRRLDGLLQGAYEGFLPGPGSEAGEARPYEPGDDVRRMDWSVTARTAVPHVRDEIADRELETWVVVDRSASLDFGTARCEKRDLALAAVAAVGFLTARLGNRMGAVVVQRGVAEHVPARPGRDGLYALLHRVATTASAEGAGPTDLAAGCELVSRLAKRRGFAVVVSDFLAPAGWERPLRALATRHDALAVEVVDPRELELPNVGFLTVVDPETGRRREVQTARASLRARYAEAAAAQRADTAAAIRRTGAAHLVLRTDRDWVLELARFVTRRRAHRTAPVGRSSS